MKRLGQNIRKLRERAALTQEAAAGTKMATRTLQRLEDGEGNPTLGTLQDLAQALRVDLTDLHEDTTTKNRSPGHSRFDPDWAESARILQALATVEPLRRLSALYLLTKDESYLEQLRALPSGAPFAQVLKKIL